VSGQAATLPAAPHALTGWAKMRGRISNPWGKPRFLVVFTWLYVAWSIVPVLIAIQFSFNSTRSRTLWHSFSLRWYTFDSNSVTNDPYLRSCLVQSLKLATLDVIIATPIGVALALGLARWRGRGSGSSNFLMLFPLVTPEIVMGVSLLLLFTHIFTFIHTGTLAMLLGHVTFSISYVVVIVRGRLFSIGKSYEEAAADLGASWWESLRLILIPLLLPAIIASAAIVFAISIDDFVISYWLSAGAGTDTVPIAIYSATRAAPLPSTNAIATVMLFVTLAAVVGGFGIWRLFTRSERAGGKSVMDDFAAFDI
jgi:spermidine/putrescine transport system permease protein